MISTNSNELESNNEIINDLYSFQNIYFNSNVPSCNSSGYPPSVTTPMAMTYEDDMDKVESNKNYDIRENNQPFPYNNTFIISDTDKYQHIVGESQRDILFKFTFKQSSILFSFFAPWFHSVAHFRSMIN